MKIQRSDINISTLQQILIACLFTSMLLFVYPFIARDLNRDVGIEEWFIVRQFEVSQITTIGEYPTVVFDRSVIKSFTADWTMEVQKIYDGKFKSFCYSSEKSRKYNVYESLSNLDVSTKWFNNIFPNCSNIKDISGRYRIILRWKIDRGQTYDKYELEKISNVFEIIM